ncbi:MAG TPA: hypothetical protein DEB39_07350, partial [Planctomycetaceae bacterium]|nr:hypothetical protein [Planctomycetaceae bacterium]
MKITAFDITRFGLWQQLSMPKLSEGLNIFYGPNEAGKTTLLEFMRSQLYGFRGCRRRYVELPKLHHRFGPAASAGESDATNDANRMNPLEDRTLIGRFDRIGSVLGGGEMMLHCQNGIFHLRRTFDPALPESAAIREDVQLTGLDGQSHGEHFLNVLLSGVDESTFNNVFAIGLDELQRLGTLGDTEAADLLFRLSIGLDRVSLVDVMKELIQSRNRLLDPNGPFYSRTPQREEELRTDERRGAIRGGSPYSPEWSAPERNAAGTNKLPLIPKLLEQRDHLLEEIADARIALREYARLLGERKQTDRLIAGLEAEIAAHRNEERSYEIAGQLVPVWDRREAIRERITAMGTVVPVPEDVMRKLEQLETDMAARQTRLASSKQQHELLRKQVGALNVNEVLWRLAPRIDVLLEEEKRILEIDRQITRFEREISAIETELAEKESHIKHGRRRSGGPDALSRPIPRKEHAVPLALESPAYRQAEEPDGADRPDSG